MYSHSPLRSMLISLCFYITSDLHSFIIIFPPNHLFSFKTRFIFVASSETSLRLTSETQTGPGGHRLADPNPPYRSLRALLVQEKGRRTSSAAGGCLHSLHPSSSPPPVRPVLIVISLSLSLSSPPFVSYLSLLSSLSPDFSNGAPFKSPH